MTKIDYTEQTLGLDRPSLEMICFRVSGASTEQCQGSHKICISNHTRAGISELFTLVVCDKIPKTYSTKCTELKGGTKAGQKSFVISDVFTVVVRCVIVQYFLENYLTSSTDIFPFSSVLLICCQE